MYPAIVSYVSTCATLKYEKKKKMYILESGRRIPYKPLPVSLSGDLPLFGLPFHVASPLISLARSLNLLRRFKETASLGRDLFPLECFLWCPLPPRVRVRAPTPLGIHSKALFRKAARSPAEEGWGGSSVAGGEEIQRLAKKPLLWIWPPGTQGKQADEPGWSHKKMERLFLAQVPGIIKELQTKT